jgi:hypothetical protein
MMVAANLIAVWCFSHQFNHSRPFSAWVSFSFQSEQSGSLLFVSGKLVGFKQSLNSWLNSFKFFSVVPMAE